MGKFIVLVLKNLGRNKVRTTLTALAITVLVLICSVVTTVTSLVEQRVSSASGQTRLMVTEKWVTPSEVPVRYLHHLASMPGVEDWTTWNLYAGFYDASKRTDRMGLGIATNVNNIREMHDGLDKLDPQIVQAMQRDRTAALMGATIMKAMNWKVGQEFTFISSSHIGKDLRFKIVGVMPSGAYPLNFFFRDDYFREGVGNKENVACVWLRVRDAKSGQEVVTRIQEAFGGREPALKVETESAGVARFAARGEAILGIIRLVVGILMIDMVIILSNSISISTRERRSEMAVLKVLGYEPMHIMTMVIGEAMFIGALSGGFGAAIAWGSSALAEAGLVPDNGFTGFLSVFPVSFATVPWGLLLGAAVGFIGSAIPAWNARKVKVSDVFSRIA
ncbi:MAG: ABC transporter permease [Planctomycetota bacterium]